MNPKRFGGTKMNIQFMSRTKEVKDPLTGDITIVYIPDFDELISNASCKEEVDMLEEVRGYINNERHPFKGFTFQICYTCKVRNLESEVECWKLYQTPWVECNGKKMSKEYMIESIRRY